MRAGLGAGAALRTAVALGPRPKLLVLVVAEQFRTDYFDSHPGAFRRLLSDGAYFPECRIDSTTFTASGLASLATGAYPNVHGVVADRWFSRAAVSANPQLLQATTLASRFRVMDSRNRVFSIAFRDEEAGYFSNGASFTSFAPTRTGSFVWRAAGASTPMRTIDFDPAKPAESAAQWRSSPLGQAAQFAALRELIVRERLGRGDGVDCVTLVLGSLGSVGYETGADSPLVFDLVTQLDQQLEGLLEALATVGDSLLTFTAAHGAPDAAGKVSIKSPDVVQSMEAALREKYGPAPASYVEAYVYPFVYLRKGTATREARQLAGRASNAAAWYTADGDCSHRGAWKRRLQNSFQAPRSGDVLLAYPPNAVEDYADGRGISYGSIYNYDARVPLILHGRQFRSHTFEGPVELVDVAPTLARAMGCEPPSSSIGRVLDEAFRA